jgi:uncharacterized membrane protein YcjF (UPF0283 family)
MLVIAFTQADAVAWICFVVGIALLVAGVAIGLWMSLKQLPRKAEEARAKLEDASAKLEMARAHVQTASTAANANLESFTPGGAGGKNAAEAAQESTEAAKTALEQVQGIVGSLPENLRFAGLLVLVGTVLMSVATVQFGGISLF